ncbi:MAG: prepilin-type N-terminal cleavage/methylation domain-containing protein [Colwellia sp.]|nr:prepilin-type N-terminal cleavage/methylation domain-containing protein [Colwellia sp.]
MHKFIRLDKVKSTQVKHYLCSQKSTKQIGFTLIEVMMTLAIIGVLAAMAYPSYVDFVTSSNRTEGQRELLRFANLQEQYFVDYRTYGADLKKLGKSSEEISTEHDHYTIKVQAANATTFELRAIAKGSQSTNDAACSPLTINQVGAKGPNGCWD